MSTQMNKLTAASLKLHMFGVFVLQTLHAEGKLPEEFDPMSLDTSIVAKFDPNEMKNLFKTNKKTKTNVKVVPSPRENVVGVIANNHYESNDDENKSDDIVMQIVNAATSDVAEKPKKKTAPKKKAAPVDTSEPAVEPVVAEEKPKKKAAPKKKAVPAEPVVVTETTEPVDATSAPEPVVVEEKPKKKAATKKKVVPAEPIVVAETTESVDVDTTTEPVVVEEKPKKKTAPKKKAVPSEPVVVAETTESVVVEEKPKKKSAPKKKAVPTETSEGSAEPQAAQNEPVVATVVANSPKKNAAIKAVKSLISPPPLTEEGEIVEEPITENKVEEEAEVKATDYHNDESEAQEDDDEDEEEIQARIMNYEGKQYLIDDKKTVYDKESFDELGTFDEDTQKIIFN